MTKENARACEAHVTLTRRQSQSEWNDEELITVKSMREDKKWPQQESYF
jgi:hypothetical protein